MGLVLRFYRSTIGKKVIVALTGIVLLGYLVAHMAGNLLIFTGEGINQYAEQLHSNPALLWAARIVLLVSVFLHILCTVQLILRKGRARAHPYYSYDPQVSSFATRTMWISGPLIAIFVVYHLLHFTTGHAHPDFKDVQPYHNLTTAFQDWRIAFVYIATMLVIGAHLVHGAWSMFQTVGLNHPRYNTVIRALAVGLSIVIAVGFIAVPVAIQLGLVK